MPTQQPLISVIVPVYKVEAFLPACVESLLCQTLADFELILVDDGSPDRCGEVCDRFAAQDRRVRVCHQKNGGLSAARNSGLGLARGAYIAFVDSDDTVLPTFLETLYTACTQADADMALCAVQDVTEAGAPLAPPVFTQPTAAGTFAGKELLAEFFGANSTCYTVAWNKLYKAQLWHGLRYPEGMLHEDDAVAHLLYWSCDRVACVEEPLYHYRLRQGSICHTDITPGSFDGVSAHAAWCRFFREKECAKSILDRAVAGCFKRYLSLCSAAGAALTWPLAARWHAAQAELRPLLSLVQSCSALTAAEKFSCRRWVQKQLPIPAKTSTKRVALLLPPGLPVPAVKGGAVEGLATELAAQNQIFGQLELAVICTADPEAAAGASRYTNTLFCYLSPAARLRRLIHTARYRLSQLRGGNVYWQEYYHQALPFLQALNPDFFLAEGGQLFGWQEASARFGAHRLLAHLHGVTHSQPALDKLYGGALAISQYVRAQWLATSALPPAQVRLLYNCVDVNRFAAPVPMAQLAALRAECGFSQEDFVVLFCGRLEEQKGVHKLVEALALLPDSSVKLLAAGGCEAGESDGFAAALKARAAALDGRVYFAGAVPAAHMPSYYQMADLTVIPTLIEEAAGLVAVEAMAAGCPVVAANSGGLPEYLQGSGAVLLDRTEALVPQLAQAIAALKDDPDRRRAMAAAGRARAAAFSPQRYYQTLVQLLNTLS